MLRAALPPSENFLALDEARSALDTSRVVIIPVPYEATSTFGHGSADGVQAIMDASHEVELFDAALAFEPCEAVDGVATLSPMDVEGLDGAMLCDKLADETGHWLDIGKFVFAIGGEHTSTVGAIKAHCQRIPDLTLLHFDAHSDLRVEYMGSQWNHACAIARVLDFHGDIVQVGIRSQCREEREYGESKGVRTFYAHEIPVAPTDEARWIAAIIESCRPDVYITFDCDCFDPSLIPATGTPEPGGLSWGQMDRLMAALCRERRIVGMDVTELAPIPGVHHPQFTIAKFINRTLGRIFI